MSVVIAIKEENRIVIGCDSQVTYGQMKSKLNNKNQSKIIDIKNCKGGLLGGVGYVRDLQLLQVQDNLIKEISILKDEVNYDYCVKNLFNDIYQVLMDNKRIEKDDKGNYKTGFEDDFIFAYKDNAFLLNGSDGTIEEIDDYLVIGSGTEIAIGVLENNKGKSADERIKEAIKSCSDKTIYVDNNVFIRSTNN